MQEVHREMAEEGIKHDHFAELIAQSEHAIHCFVFSLLPRRSEADDVMQETVKRLLEHYDEYDPKRPFTPWACQFAYRVVQEFRRKEAVRRKFFSNVVVEALAINHRAEDEWIDDQRQALQTCLQLLCEKDQALIQQRYSGSKSITELSIEQGRSPNSLYKRLQKIRQQLVECVSHKVLPEGQS